METIVTFRVECDSHFWNFSDKTQAERAAKELPQCKEGYKILEIKQHLFMGQVLFVKETLLNIDKVH